MTNYQESVGKMSASGELFLTTNKVIIASIPNLSTYLATIQSLNVQLKSAFVQQESENNKNAKIKQSMRAELIVTSMDLIRKLVAYAMNSNNKTLSQQIKYTESSLTKASDTKLVGICQIIYNAANTNIANLATYGVTAATNAAFQNTINTYNAIVVKDRVDATDGGASTKLISDIIKQLNSTWLKIDILVNTVKLSQPAFFNEYYKVRKIINTASGSLAVKGLVTDVLNGEPIKGAVITFVRTDGGSADKRSVDAEQPFVKMSADKGGFNIKSLPEGMYKVTVSKVGYADQSVSIVVANGELAELKVELAKK